MPRKGSRRSWRGESRSTPTGKPGVAAARTRDSESPEEDAGEMLRVRGPQDFVGGVLLVAIGILGWLLIRRLPMGTAFRMGPAYVPTVVSGLIAAVGVILAARSLLVQGPRLEADRMRPLGVVLGSFVLFGLLIEGAGLVLASLALVLIAGFAAREQRWKEAIVVGAVLTAFAVILFHVLLGLPMPVWPRWI
jgi:putative tricarboxylic transport membrane protein